MKQITDILGHGFLPVLKGLNVGLQGFLSNIQILDDRFPGLSDKLLIGVGGLLAFGAALAAVGFVWPAITSGFGLFVGLLKLAWMPMGLLLRSLASLAGLLGAGMGIAIGLQVLVLAFVAAAYDIYAHWGRFKGFFEAIWSGVKDIFGGFIDWVSGFFTGDSQRAAAGVYRMWHGLVGMFGGIWGAVEQLFTDFCAWVDGWSGGAATKAVQGIKDAWNGLRTWFATLWADIRAPFEAFVVAVQNSAIGRWAGLASAPQLSPAAAAAGAGDHVQLLPQSFRGDVRIGFDDDGVPFLRRATTSDPAVRITPAPPNTGRVLGRP